MKPSRLPPFVVIACSVAFFWSLSVRTVVYASMPVIASDLQLTGSLAGIALSSLLLGICLGTFPAGWLPGSRKGRILGSTLVALPLVAMLSSASDLLTLAGTGLALGLAIGVYRPLGLSLVFEAGGANRAARYMAVHETSASLASFAGAAFVGATMAWLSWRNALRSWCVVGLGAYLTFTKVEEKEAASQMSAATDPLEVDARLLWAIATQTASSMLLGGLNAMLPLILVRGWGVEQSFAAWLVGYAKLVNLLGVFLAGIRGDRWGHARLAQYFQGAAAVGCAIMAMSGYGAVFLGGFAVMSVAAGGLLTVLPAVVAASYPAVQRDRALATSIAISNFFGSVATPPLFGALLDAGMPSAPIYVTAAVSFAAIFATGRLAPRPRIELSEGAP